MTSLFRELVSAPITPCCSRTRTSCPWTANARAMANPTTPAPMTIVSTSALKVSPRHAGLTTAGAPARHASTPRSLGCWLRSQSVARDLWPHDAVGRIFAAPGLALEVGAWLNRQRVVIDVTFDVAGGLQHHLLATNRPHHLPPHYDHVGNNSAGKPAMLPDHDGRAMNLTLYFTLDMDFALTNEIAYDHQVTSDERRGIGLSRSRSRFRRWGANGRKCRRFGCHC